jgi:hypothetical protein
MDVDCLLSPSDPEDRPEEPAVEDPYLADLLRVADNTIAQLREEARQAKAQKEGLDGKINGFRKQVGYFFLFFFVWTTDLLYIIL